jgi:hypothetical protein
MADEAKARAEKMKADAKVRIVIPRACTGHDKDTYMCTGMFW